ncbi:hypothetical protein FVE85_6202 [Porphyridium purpureum]|uniref:High light inducible protein n=1 Tax=Porphyridium purpureum TaxID=35688 RepID=A0A5J4Z7I7_PORPP|nr:hypothetical protein FVE85_6202 [Porphyridium purpureum]|eukprot:POR2673..scf295_1
MAAFVNGCGIAANRVPVSQKQISFKSAPVSRRNTKTIVALKDDSKDVLDKQREQLRQAEELPRQAGWTAYAERVNGRLAMIFFVVGLVTNIVSPEHPGLVDQILWLPHQFGL